MATMQASARVGEIMRQLYGSFGLLDRAELEGDGVVCVWSVFLGYSVGIGCI